MNYATLSEAYNVESFDKKKEKGNMQHNKDININIEEYNKDFSHCEPIQPPHFKLPVSNKAMEKYNDAYQIFIKDRKVSENKTYNQNNQNNIINTKKNNDSNAKSSINLYENYDKIRNDKVDSIEPYYDEDLDNYLNLSDFNNNNLHIQKVCDDDYKKTLMNYDYNLKTQDVFNHNKDDYVLVSKKDLMEFNNTLNKKNENSEISDNNVNIFAENINNIPPKIDIKTNSNNDVFNYTNNDVFNYTNNPLDEIIINNPINNNKIYEKYENVNKGNIFYKSLINIAIFILIGIFIIYLLDLLIELSLNKGMKKTLDTLLPLLEELKELKK